MVSRVLSFPRLPISLCDYIPLMGRWLVGGGTFSDGAEPNPSEEAKVSRVMSPGDDGQDHSLQWP